MCEKVNSKRLIKPGNPVRERILTVAIFLSFCTPALLSQVTLSEQQWTIPTYLVAPPDVNPIFFRGESYQGASRVVYPYALNDVISTEREEHSWKTVILENEYIKLCVTPEIGGKLYYATDKTNNYNFIYKNNVVRPSNIGMLGAWVSGGIEWCVIHHHRASTFLPVDYFTTENSDGSKSIWIGETEPRHGMRWTISITAFPGKSYFMAEGKIINPTSNTNTFLYWANVAAHTNSEYQVIFPPSVDVATYHAKNSFTWWPFATGMYNGQDFSAGVDISRWINSPNSNSFFAYDLKEDFMGGYDHGRETGTVHIGDHNIVKGAKLWEWGSGPRGQATEARLTENDGPYVEIMTGAYSDNQPDYSWIRPYEVKRFRQYWYPVKDIGGFKNANINGAVNLEVDGNEVFIGFYSTGKIEKARFWLMNGNKVVFETESGISPQKAFTRKIKLSGKYSIYDLKAGMTDTQTGEEIISYQPAEAKKDESLPETVKRPPAPQEIGSVEELFLTGSRILQFYNPTLNAMDYFNEALRRDPGDVRTNTAIGSIHLKNGEYEKARISFATAIRRLTRDYTRPSTCEALYLQGITLRKLGLTDEAEDTLYRASWDYAWHSASMLELARIYTERGNYRKALDLSEEALTTNSLNNGTLNLKSALLRKLGHSEKALEVTGSILKSDPLDMRASYEAFLAAEKATGSIASPELLSQFRNKMRDSEQNYLDLAVSYINDGLYDEAASVLELFSGKFPLVSYYLGYLADRDGRKAEASEYFRQASAMPTDYCFPFRLETALILNKALAYNPDDSRALYYLGNLYYDRQPENAIDSWESAVKKDPGLAIAFRNLGWGYYRHYGDGKKAITFYEKAIELDKSQPIYYEELDALYEMSNAPIEKRIKLFDGSNEIVSARDDAFARQLTVLTLAGKPQDAVSFLEGRNFSYREGSSRVRDIIIDAHITNGIRLMKEGRSEAAATEFLNAHIPEEEAGGSRYGNRNVEADYFTGLAYEAAGQPDKSKEYYLRAADAPVRDISYLAYYKGLSMKKLGRAEEGNKLFRALAEEGNRQITGDSAESIDFFAKFGEREAKDARLSNAYLLHGLGMKGLGDRNEAMKSLTRATELSASNLRAITELAGLAENWNP